METAKSLIRGIVRAFYETKHVLVLDALMLHSALPVEDLAYLLGMQPKDLRKLCGKLREDRLLAVHSRPEIRDGMLRPINKDYYYIDFHTTIDSIKYKMFFLTEKVKELYKPTTEKKDFFCPNCKAQWTQLEVLDKVGAMGFECHRCGGVLEREERQEGDATGHEMQSKLMSQLDSFIKMLQRIDSEDLPNRDFTAAMAAALPVQRNSTVNPLRPYQPVNKDASASAVRGMTPTVVALDVSITTGEERSATEQAEEAKRKASIAAQNALPVWHTKSTVTGERTAGDKESTNQAAGAAALKSEEDSDEKKENNVLNDELTAYYAQLAQEREKEAREEREADESSGEDEDDDDDDEDDEQFEDVDAASTAKGTAKNNASNGNEGTPAGQGDSSGDGTNASTPAQQQRQTQLDGSSGDGEADGPAIKRVKFEESANGAGGAKEDVVEKDSDEDEDDEVEFEDV